MLEFPRMIYRAGGPHDCEGVMCDYRVIDSAQAFEAAQAEGWRLTHTEAAEAAKPEPGESADDAPDDDAPPTRAEMLQKAAELGIKVDGRWSDKRLAEAIAAKV